MIRRDLLFAALSLPLLLSLASCASKPTVVVTSPTEPQASLPQVAPPAPPVEVAPVSTFDPSKVTEEEKKVTFVDIRAFIVELNTIIQRKDYEGWLAHLTPEFIDYYSSPAVLGPMAEAPVLKRMGIRILTLKDYFMYVVYPSRQNDHVDDIEFIGDQRVKAVTFGPKGDRQILYYLEKHGDTWKIGIGR
jgi:hypothetical protein